MHTLKYIALLIVLCQVVDNVVSQQPELVSFGDFMEFDIGFHKACENAPGGPNTTWPIVRAFTECTFNLSPNKPRDNFESMASICQNRGKYLACYDKLRSDAIEKCGSDREGMLPAVYRATVASLCGNDNGAKTIESLKKALTEITPDAKNTCPEETGIHWIENCKVMLPTMHSSDLCARHTAIDKCLQKITCDNIRFGKILRQIYTDGRQYLQCNERRV